MSTLQNLKIAYKLAVAFAAVILVSAVVSLGVWQKTRFVEDSSKWTTHTYEVLDRMDEIMAAMVDQETGVRGFLIAGDDRFLEPYRAGVAAYETAFAEVKRLTADNPAQQARLDELNRIAQTWRTTVAEKEIALMGKAETRDEAHQMVIKGAGKAAMDGVRTKVAEIEKVERDLLAVRDRNAREAFSSTYLILLIGAAASVAASALIGWLLTRSIAAPIVQMTGVMTKLAAGDKKVDVPGLGRKDEVGAMASAVQVFKETAIKADQMAAEQAAEQQRKEARQQAIENHIKAFDQSITGALGALASAATELRSTAETMTATAEKTSRQATTVAAASEQASSNVQTVATAGEELASSIAEIGRQVAQATKIAGKAVEEAQKTDVKVQGLAEAAQKIGEVVQLITDIAAQTNLLALNATIEAARAGEAGKGFAVVASEVKSLANQTAKATEEIAQQIAAIQGATKESVEAIQSIGRTIGEINEIATTIASAVEEQGAATQEIARNVQQAAKGTQEVSTNITGVTQAAGETGAAAAQVLGSAEELSKQGEALRSEVGRFLENIRAA